MISTISDAGEILDPPVAVGEGSGGLAPGQHEGDPERNGSGGVADIVDGVGKQRDAARDDDHAICKPAVTARIANDHLIAQMPRAVVVMLGSITP